MNDFPHINLDPELIRKYSRKPIFGNLEKFRRNHSSRIVEPIVKEKTK